MWGENDVILSIR